MGTDAAPGGEQMTIEDTESNVYELIGNPDSGTLLDRDELERLELFRSVKSSLFEPILRGCPVQSLAPGDVLIQRRAAK